MLILYHIAYKTRLKGFQISSELTTDVMMMLRNLGVCLFFFVEDNVNNACIYPNIIVHFVKPGFFSLGSLTTRVRHLLHLFKHLRMIKRRSLCFMPLLSYREIELMPACHGIPCSHYKITTIFFPT